MALEDVVKGSFLGGTMEHPILSLHKNVQGSEVGAMARADAELNSHGISKGGLVLHFVGASLLSTPFVGREMLIQEGTMPQGGGDILHSKTPSYAQVGAARGKGGKPAWSGLFNSAEGLGSKGGLPSASVGIKVGSAARGQPLATTRGDLIGVVAGPSSRGDAIKNSAGLGVVGHYIILGGEMHLGSASGIPSVGAGGASVAGGHSKGGKDISSTTTTGGEHTVGPSSASQKAWRKKKPARPAAKKIPVAKTTVMKKEAGAVRGLAPENGPGWCFVCQRNCVTEVALKQHLEGKGHKRQAELQKERAELAAKAVDENGGGVASMLEQMWVQVSMMGKPPRVGKTKKKPKTQGQPKDAKPMDPEQKDLEPKAEGEVADAMPTTDVKPEAELKAEPKAEGRPRTTRSRRAKSTDAPKVQEIVRCDICGVECNSKAVLEIHFGGKKHAARVKKLQESAAPSNAEQTTSEQTNAEQTTLSAQ